MKWIYHKNKFQSHLVTKRYQQSITIKEKFNTYKILVFLLLIIVKTIMQSIIRDKFSYPPIVIKTASNSPQLINMLIWHSCNPILANTATKRQHSSRFWILAFWTDEWITIVSKGFDFWIFYMWLLCYHCLTVPILLVIDHLIELFQFHSLLSHAIPPSAHNLGHLGLIIATSIFLRLNLLRVHPIFDLLR